MEFLSSLASAAENLLPDMGYMVEEEQSVMSFAEDTEVFHDIPESSETFHDVPQAVSELDDVKVGGAAMVNEIQEANVPDQFANQAIENVDGKPAIPAHLEQFFDVPEAEEKFFDVPQTESALSQAYNNAVGRLDNAAQSIRSGANQVLDTGREIAQIGQDAYGMGQTVWNYAPRPAKQIFSIWAGYQAIKGANSIFQGKKRQRIE